MNNEIINEIDSNKEEIPIVSRPSCPAPIHVQNYIIENFNAFEFDEIYEDTSELEKILSEKGVSDNKHITNFEFTTALLASNTKAEFVRTLASLSKFKYGVEINGDISDETFEGLLTILKLELTKQLFTRKDDKTVRNLILILEKRMTEHFGRNREAIIEDGDSDIKIEFEVVRSK